MVLLLGMGPSLWRSKATRVALVSRRLSEYIIENPSSRPGTFPKVPSEDLRRSNRLAAGHWAHPRPAPGERYCQLFFLPEHRCFCVFQGLVQVFKTQTLQHLSQTFMFRLETPVEYVSRYFFLQQTETERLICETLGGFSRRNKGFSTNILPS